MDRRRAAVLAFAVAAMVVATVIFKLRVFAAFGKYILMLLAIVAVVALIAAMFGRDDQR